MTEPVGSLIATARSSAGHAGPGGEFGLGQARSEAAFANSAAEQEGALGLGSALALESASTVGGQSVV